MIKTYVEFFVPGSFFSESSVKEVTDRSSPKNIPDNVFAYRFYDIEEVVLNGEKLKSNTKNHSGMYYFGKAYTLSEIKENFPSQEILISNMKCNNWKKVVKTKMGNFQPLNENDVVFNC